ncbi:hypothetical protein [Aggregatibacter actinomycetemcomitans]|uniref:hypothetical protein n=1 Tax=Aggregatibacter actinomycetemcomitans TaxID=714 RepID=UPI00197C6CF2|nr:hypothetical protein [Aggregatibacter actinomycetemcomitans]MBN6078800.1 hypothetical protein [Aggregatibacter actinomycetemcomitans]
MGNDVFYLGAIMRVCRCSWFCGLIFLLLVSDVALSAPRCWSWSTIPKGGSSNLQSGQKEIKTSCKLNGGSGYKLCGDLSKEYNNTIMESDDTGFTIHYRFVEQGFFHDGYNQADEQFNFGAGIKSMMSGAMSKSLMNALKNNNCDIAQKILDALQNPNIKKDDQGNDYTSIENNGDTCVIKDNGESKCEWRALERDSEGNPRITMSPNRSGSLDDYANSNAEDKSGGNNSQKGDKQGGNNGVDERRGNGSSSNNNNSLSPNGGNNNAGGSSSADKGKGDGTGNKGGTGIGNGKGDGKGDDEKEGKGELPKLQEFNIGDSLERLKGKLAEMIDTSSCSVSGKCPAIQVSLFGATHNIDIHCKIFEDNFQKIRTAFNFLWALLGILIILSA